MSAFFILILLVTSKKWKLFLSLTENKIALQYIEKIS